MVSPVVLEVPGRGVLPRCRSGGEILLAAQPPPVHARPPALALGKRQSPPAGAPHCHQALHSALGHRVLTQPTDAPPFVTLRGVGVLSPRPGFSGTSVCLSVPRSGASPGECRVQGSTLQVWISGEATQSLSGLRGLSVSSPQGTSRFETCLLEETPLGIRVAPGLDLRVRSAVAPLSLPRRLLEQLGVQSKNECGPGKNQWSRGASGCRENIPEGQFCPDPSPWPPSDGDRVAAGLVGRRGALNNSAGTTARGGT